MVIVLLLMDDNSTLVAFDVEYGNGFQVKANGECEGNNNSNGPIDNNNDNDYNINTDNNVNNGGGRKEAQTWDDCRGA